MKKNIIKLGIIGLLGLALCGCFRTERLTPQQYAFEVQKPTKIKTSPSKVLEINSTSIAQQFASANFVYRTSDINYLTDYYNVFFTPPAQQINQTIIDYLQAKNIFSYIANDTEQLKTNYILYSEVTELYADYRNPAQPQAVIAIDFTLFTTKKTALPLMHKLFTAKVPLSAKDSDSLMHAWNQGLQQILADLSKSLVRF